jgi:hypothetical protein
LGLSYGQFEVTALTAGAVGGVQAKTLRTSYYGATILQSLVEGLILGGTFKYVRGDVATAISDDETVGAALDGTNDLRGARSGVVDLDVGLLADMQRLRIGITWRNLRSPEFGDDATGRVRLPRQTRLGVALVPSDGLTLAMDIDLDTVGLRGDLRRMFALGGEGRIGQRLAVRTGLRWSLEGARHLVGSAGLSIGLRRGFWLDGHYAQSHLDEDREFGVALRAGL